MQRVCEPELMLAPDQVLAYAAADFSAGDGAMVERLAARWRPAPAARLIDLGCGPGNISLLLAARWPDLQVVGLDGSTAMLAIAEQRRQALGAAAAGLRFAQALLPLDGTALAALAPPFTAVVSNSLLHHLHQPAVFWQAVRALGAPGAVVQVHDLRRPDDEGAVAALLARHGEGMPEVLRRDYDNSLRAAFTPEEVAAQLAEAGLNGLRVVADGDQYLVVEGCLPDGPAAPA